MSSVNVNFVLPQGMLTSFDVRDPTTNQQLTTQVNLVGGIASASTSSNAINVRFTTPSSIVMQRVDLDGGDPGEEQRYSLPFPKSMILKRV